MLAESVLEEYLEVNLKILDKLSIIKRNGTIHPISIKQLFVFEGIE